jgi:predicted HicB family RNase H-like nuclease
VQLHKEIKMKAVERGLSIKKYIIRAIIEQILRDEEYK